MEIKLLDGGIYNFKIQDAEEFYIIVIKQGYDSVVILFPHMFIKNMKRIHKRDILNDVCHSADYLGKIKEEYFQKVSNFLDKNIIGYLGQIDDELLKKLRVLAVCKYPWI